jgi:hypothetical protein
MSISAEILTFLRTLKSDVELLPISHVVNIAAMSSGFGGGHTLRAKGSAKFARV